MSVRARRERDRERRRREILDAAERVFLRRGSHATMEDIAAEALVAKGTVYLYFAGKDELYLALIGKALDVLRQKLETVIAEPGSIESHLRGFFIAYVAYYREHPNLFQLLDRSGYPVIHSGMSPDILEDTYRKSQGVWELITGVLQRGMDEGALRADVSAFELAVIFWNNTNGFLRLIDGMTESNIWAGRRDRYAIHADDLYRMLDISSALLLDAVLRVPGGGSETDRTS